MKKKILIAFVLMLSVFSLAACGKKTINLNDYLIEKRENLFTAEDELYSVTFSTGLREENYALDGVVGNMVEFGVITFARNDREPLANDSYTYVIKIGEESLTGFLEKSPIDNTYSADIGKACLNDATISMQITFTGYSFNKELVCTSKEFTVDNSTAIDLANKELKNELKNISSDKNNKIECVMKIMKDMSTEQNNYYWYVGVISTNGNTLGILIDAKTGEVISKKV